MADNKKMQTAKAVKNDEFYTEWNTISNEMGHYREQFRGKTVYCNCDDPSWSNFWKYFHSNFASLCLKKLISTHYSKNSEPSYALIYEGGDDFNIDAGTTIPIYGNGDYFAGDFRSDDCLKLLKEADIVSTNPPFSLFRAYLQQLVDFGKQFIVLGNQNAIINRETFPLFQSNKVWYGASIHSGGVDFRMPDDYIEYSDNVFIRNGHHYINLAGIRWFTNMDVKYRHDGLWHKNGRFDNSQAHKYYEGFEERYPKYENYNAIEVGKTKDIPIDYKGIMAVPITWFDKYNPEEFEIIWQASGNTRASAPKDILNILQYKAHPEDRGGCGVLNGKRMYSRIFIRNLHPIAKADDKGY